MPRGKKGIVEYWRERIAKWDNREWKDKKDFYEGLSSEEVISRYRKKFGIDYMLAELIKELEKK